MWRLLVFTYFMAFAFAIEQKDDNGVSCPGQGSCGCDWTNGGANCGGDDGSECWCRCCCQYRGGNCHWNPTPGPSPGGHNAGTSRYWDCNQPFCEPGNLPYPHSYRMFTMSDGRVFGHAAASDSILQGHNNCEHCYELTYGGHKMVVKVDNWCPCNSNPSCCRDHFDLAVPGTDYAPSSASNVCQQSDRSIDYSKGRQQCSHWPWEDNSSCCNSVSSDQQLNAACRLFTEVLNWDNPDVQYTATGCPYEEMEAYDVFWSKKSEHQEVKNLTALLDYQDKFIQDYVAHRNGTMFLKRENLVN